MQGTITRTYGNITLSLLIGNFVRSIKGNWQFRWKFHLPKKNARANMEYEIRSLKGYRFGVQYMWEKEIFCQGRVINHAIGWKTHDHFRCKTFYAYGVRQLPDKWSLYKQYFLGLVQERIVHIWHITHLTVTTAEGVESELAKSFLWQKAFDEIWKRPTRI